MVDMNDFRFSAHGLDAMNNLGPSMTSATLGHELGALDAMNTLGCG